MLKGYCELKGNAINDYMSCHFANGFSKNEKEFFGIAKKAMKIT